MTGRWPLASSESATALLRAAIFHSNLTRRSLRWHAGTDAGNTSAWPSSFLRRTASYAFRQDYWTDRKHALVMDALADPPDCPEDPIPSASARHGRVPSTASLRTGLTILDASSRSRMEQSAWVRLCRAGAMLRTLAVSESHVRHHPSHFCRTLADRCHGWHVRFTRAAALTGSDSKAGLELRGRPLWRRRNSSRVHLPLLRSAGIFKGIVVG